MSERPAPLTFFQMVPWIPLGLALVMIVSFATVMIRSGRQTDVVVVNDRTGEPIAGVGVVGTDFTTGARSQCWTDARGACVLSLAHTPARLQVSADGWDPVWTIVMDRSRPTIFALVRKP